MPRKVIEPELFDLLDDYVGLLDDGEAIVDDVVPATSSLILFTESAFSQFFDNELGVAIEGFDDRAKKKAVAARAEGKGQLSHQARLIISVFLNFCDEYDDVKSASYGGQGEILEQFHARRVIRLVQRVRGLAKVNGEDELEERAEVSLARLKQVVDTYPWSDHDREEE
jgi:YesN/AraC family two-component response regulator